ncbi:MAG: (Fe-S)-binding protein [Gemmataceae bacterium]
MATTETTRTPLAVLPSPPNQAPIDYELFLDCVHCGLCTASCPTYVELGTEMDSPRGRIYLMRSVQDGKLELNAEVRRHLDLCLDCRACESACPSGVQYGRLIEPFRVHMAKSAPPDSTLSLLQRLLLFHLTPYNSRTRWALMPAKLMQWAGLDKVLEWSGLLNVLPASLRQLYDMLPRLEVHYGSLPEVLPAEGKRRARVALFIGCAGDAFFPQTTLRTAQVLQKNGCEVWIPRNQTCCGALYYHAALEKPAQEKALANCEAFGPGLVDGPDAVDAIIVNAAGCGAMLKDYHHLLHDTPAAGGGQSFQAKVRDIHEFLTALGPIPPRHPVPLRGVYHDACHLCHAQQIRQQPRQLLEMIPELQLVPLNESEICCGAAGSYNLTQPDMAERLGRRKADNILQAEPQAVFTGNVGCLLQIGRYLRPERSDIWVAHPIDALWASYFDPAAVPGCPVAAG